MFGAGQRWTSAHRVPCLIAQDMKDNKEAIAPGGRQMAVILYLDLGARSRWKREGAVGAETAFNVRYYFRHRRAGMLTG